MFKPILILRITGYFSLKNSSGTLTSKFMRMARLTSIKNKTYKNATQ